MPGQESLKSFEDRLIQYQIGPALILSSTRDVVAANESSLRLICALPDDDPQSQWFDNPLVGQKVSDLNIILTPGCKPVYRDWDTLFEATNIRKSTSEPAPLAPTSSEVDLRNSTPSSEEDDEARSARYNRNLVRDTDDYWDDESKRQPPKAESDVIVLSQHPSVWSDPSRSSTRYTKSIKARMTVSLWTHNDIEFYLILFRRSIADPGPMLEDAKNYAGLIKGIRSSATVSKSGLSNVETINSIEEAPALASATEKNFDLTTPEDIEIQNQLIPHIMAILNTEGQAMCFSDSWYQFCGLTEAESLGSGWYVIVFCYFIDSNPFT
jgi:hypothetical protein